MSADARDAAAPRAERSEAPRETTPSTRVIHREHLWVSAWIWLIALGIAAVLSAEVHMGWPQVPAALPYPFLLAIAAAAMFRLGRARVAVVEGPDGRELQVGEARLPTRFIARTVVVPRSAKSAAMGRQLDPAAYVLHRPWVGPMVVAVLDDPDDPTPYWIFSSRNPEAVISALGVPTAEHRPTSEGR